MNLGSLRLSIRKPLLVVLSLGLFLPSLFAAQPWKVLGPEGGDVRSFAYNPKNPAQIFLGTSTGSIFVSSDDGRSWSRFVHLGNQEDYVLDHILIDPSNPDTMYVAAWSVETLERGDVFRTHDGGKTWQALSAMHNKSVRAMTMSPADSKVLLAGAIDGVFRTTDGGETWKRVSPEGHAEIKNIESVAIDPKDINTMYAGTWHLAWKTSDGGATWNHITKGMVEDSDVFSIIVDTTNPSVVFASACSGIYKSTDAGDLFHKIQGIPFSARRTRVLRQDPSNPTIVYAGTTEGLWKTADLGATWKQMTSGEIVVNDVMVDPRDSKRVMLATDRNGVLVSDDGAARFSPSNHGYSHRYVSSLIADAHDPSVLYVGLVNDRELGGVFYSADSGNHWQQKSEGLAGRDVFALQQSESGAIVAGTSHGVYILEPKTGTWRASNIVVQESVTEKTVYKNKKKTKVQVKTVKKSTLEARVNDLQLDADHWLAVTTAGLYTSTDNGKTWMSAPPSEHKDFVTARYQGDLAIAATRSHVLVSKDHGSTWDEAKIWDGALNVRSVAISPQGGMFVAAREGFFRSPDSGTTWEHIYNGLPDRELTSIVYDQNLNRLLLTSYVSSVIYESSDGGRHWKLGPDTGYPLRRVSIVAGRFLAATPFDGVIMQPELESTSASAASH
jgi:photosystem II stability/assembly factor-like uncharacterized protein